MPDKEYQHLRALKAKYRDSLFSLPNVTGVGIGRKSVGGEFTDERSVRVYVEEKKPLHELGPGERVPDELEGVPTDVIEAGPARLSTDGAPPEPVYTDRERPAKGGCSISEGLNIGTLGVVCRDRTDNTRVILSNNHVIANYDIEGLEEASIGDIVRQPGVFDGEFPPPPEDTIAELKRWKKLKLEPETNVMDAAIAEAFSAEDLSPEIHEIGAPRGYRALTLDDVDETVVRKVGRTTGLTSGYVLDLYLDTFVVTDDGNVHFEDQILAGGIDDPYQAGGDSGSAVVDEDGMVVGLHWGGFGSDAGIASPIVPIFDELEIDVQIPSLPVRWTGEAGEGNCTCLVFDGRYLYAGIDADPMKVIKIDPETMTTVSVLTGPIRAYVGTDKVGEALVTRARTAGAGQTHCSALTFDSLFIYVGLRMKPARVLRKVMRDIDEMEL